MYRFVLTPRWIAFTFVAILLCTAFAGLSHWQWDRHTQRRAVNQVIAANLNSTPTPADQILKVGQPFDPQKLWHTITVTGHYDTAHTLLLRNTEFEDQVGYDVIVPLVTDQGTALLVDRGWLNHTASSTTVPAIPAAPSGTVTVTGRLRTSEASDEPGSKVATGLPNNEVNRLDVESIASGLSYPVYDAYVELMTETPPGFNAPTPQPPPDIDEGPYRAYAVEWILFIGVAIVGYVILIRAEARNRLEDAETANDDEDGDGINPMDELDDDEFPVEEAPIVWKADGPEPTKAEERLSGSGAN